VALAFRGAVSASRRQPTLGHLHLQPSAPSLSREASALAGRRAVPKRSRSCASTPACLIATIPTLEEAVSGRSLLEGQRAARQQAGDVDATGHGLMCDLLRELVNAAVTDPEASQRGNHVT